MAVHGGEERMRNRRNCEMRMLILTWPTSGVDSGGDAGVLEAAVEIWVGSKWRLSEKGCA